MTIPNDQHRQENYTKNTKFEQHSSNLDLGFPIERSEKSSLGITTKSASTLINIDFDETLKNKFANNENRYALQKIAQRYHPDKRICSCMKTIAPTASNVKVVYNDEQRHAHYRNLMRCDSVWLCPVCAGRISSRRADEIRQAYSYAIETLDFRIIMVTYTMQHSIYNSLEDSVTAMREARRKMRSGRDWQKFSDNYGYRGCISALELTWSMDAGWHVHVHEIMFLDPETAIFELHPDDTKLQKWLTSELSPRWQKSCEAVGRYASAEHGLSIDMTDQYVTEYVAKYGRLPESVSWDIASEIAQGNRKQSNGGLHPFQILELSDSELLTEDQRVLYRALWYEYAEAFYGKRQIYWTNGLKDLLCVDVAVEDSDIEETGEIVFIITREMWQIIVQLDKRGDLLNKTIEYRADTAQIDLYLRQLVEQVPKIEQNRDHWRKPNV